jgi:hypothetical protein
MRAPLPILSKLEDAVTGQAGASIPRQLGPFKPVELIERGGSFRNSGRGFQEWPEARNDVADKLTQLMERWKDSISLTNRRLDERFLAREIHIAIRFRVANTGEEWFVCADRYAEPGKDNVVSNWQDETVLVGIVEFVEQPERAVPVSVRFERIDSFYRLPLHTLYLSSSPVGFITVRAMRNRKLDHFPRLRPTLSLVDPNHDEVVSQMIEGTSQVMNCIPDESRDFGVIDDERAEMKEWISGFLISLAPNALSLKHTGVQKEIFQFSDVLIGPFNFYVDQAQSVVGRPW